jgi:hypothetical protein
MKLSRRFSQTVLLLCLLVMQSQLWASVTLGCRHEATVGLTASAPCPFHSAGAQQGDQAHPAGLLDCQKCVLHLAVGVPALAASPPALALPAVSCPSTVPVEPHFYRFAPDAIHRPPIA